MCGDEYSDGEKEQRLRIFEHRSIAALEGPKVDVSLEEIRKIGLIAALRAKIRK